MHAERKRDRLRINPPRGLRNQLGDTPRDRLDVVSVERHAALLSTSLSASRASRRACRRFSNAERARNASASVVVADSGVWEL
jgi:hypothetical protein